MKKGSTLAKRTILYYPTIGLPRNAWLGQALLYWDQVSSIVPHSYMYDWPADRFSQMLRQLEQEGEYRPIYSDALMYEHTNVSEQFAHELETILDSRAYMSRRRRSSSTVSYRLHHDKFISLKVYKILETRGLVRPNQDNERDTEWISCEQTAARVYMALLARFFADMDQGYTVPGTDSLATEQLVDAAGSETEGTQTSCCTMKLHNLLPTPRADVSLEEIIAFKRKRRDELLTFRKCLDDYQKQLQQVHNNNEIQLINVQFREQLEQAFCDLMATLSEAKLLRRLDTLRVLLTMSAPSIVGVAYSLLTGTSPVASTPIEFQVLGMAAVGALEVGIQRIRKRQDERMLMRQTPFAYIYLAQQQGLIFK
jgi:hypothetical protein